MKAVKYILAGIVILMLLSSANALENYKNPEKLAEKLELKGYHQGYKNGSIDKNMSEYEDEEFDYTPEVIWNEKEKNEEFKDNFSELSVETMEKYSGSFKKGWIEGYNDVWKGNPKKGQAEKRTTSLGTVYLGMDKQALNKLYKRRHRKGYVRLENKDRAEIKEWITFSGEKTKRRRGTITFYLENNIVKWWDK